jgi:hypothetical protein
MAMPDNLLAQGMAIGASLVLSLDALQAWNVGRIGWFHALIVFACFAAAVTWTVCSDSTNS